MNYYVYGIFVHVYILYAAAFRSSMRTLDTYCSIICSSLFLNRRRCCHTTEMVVDHKASRLIDLTTPLGHDPIRSMFESWCRDWIYRIISSKISLSLLSLSSDLSVSIVAVPTVLMHKVTYKVWSVFNFHGWLHPQKLKYEDFLRTKYLQSTVDGRLQQIRYQQQFTFFCGYEVIVSILWRNLWCNYEVICEEIIDGLSGAIMELEGQQ